MVACPGPATAAMPNATAIWAKPVGRMPRAVSHCRTPQDVQSAIRAARDCDLPLSVRGGGHDWAGRALCDGLVIDLSGDERSDAEPATIALHGFREVPALGRSRDDRSLGLAVVTGSCSSVGMTGLTLGGGYGSLIGRFGLALDNMIAADVVLADGRIVTANTSKNRNCSGRCAAVENFGVVTVMRHRPHDLPSVHSGMLLFPFVEARAVLEGCIDIWLVRPRS